jgi:putative ABC transport system permease protein
MIFTLVSSNLTHRPVRTALSIAAIALEVTMILTLVGVSYGTLDESARRARGVGADLLVRPPGTSILSLSSAPMPDTLLDFVARQPHVALVAGTAVQPLSGFDTVTGIDLDALSRMSGGFHFIEGGPFKAPNDVLLDEYYAREHHLHPGSWVQLMGRTWHVAGIFESGKLARICVQLPVLGEITGNPHRLSQIYIKSDDPSHNREILDALHARMPGYQIYTMEEFISLLTINNVGMLRNFIGVVIGVATIVGFLAVFMSIYTAVLERTREIGILKALGASSSFIAGLLVRETLLLALLGSAAGIGLTYLTQWLIHTLSPASLTQETVYIWWPIATAIAVAGALLGVVVPVTKALRQDATEALSYE